MIRQIDNKFESTNQVDHIIQTTVGYIFSKYVYCDMQFLIENISALLCFLDGFGIAVPVFTD